MKKLLVCLLLVVFFVGCRPLPDQPNVDIGDIDVTTAAPKNGTDAKTPWQFTSLKASIPYGQTAIPIDASVTAFSQNEFYTYTVTGRFYPKAEALFILFPVLKGKADIPTDANGRLLPPANFCEDDRLLSVSEQMARIIVRQTFASEERIDNEYGEGDDFAFPLSYAQAEAAALSAARTLCDLNDYSFRVKSVRRFGKYTGKNYYVFSLETVFDGVSFSSFGRKITTGQDEQGYANTTILKGGNSVEITLDEEGIAQMSWNLLTAAREQKVEIMDYVPLLSRLAGQVMAYPMNNFADFTFDPVKQAYVEDSVKPYVITDITMLYAQDYQKPEKPDKNKTVYLPCWKFSSVNGKGTECYIIVNAVTGEILNTRF